MTAATKDIYNAQQGDDPRPMAFNPPVAASTTIYGGTMVALNAAGNAVPASADSTLKVIGCAELKADNSAGAAGDIRVSVKTGVFRFQNSLTTEALTVADIGQPCYAADDQTLSRSSAAGANPMAGIFLGLDPVNSQPTVELAMDLSADKAHETHLISTSDLSAKQYYLVNSDTALACVLASVAGQLCIGVVQTATAAAARARVRTSGISKVVLGGTVAIGDLLTCDSAGKAVTAHGADRVIGTALEAGTTGQTKQMRIERVGAFAEHAPFTVTQHRNLADLADAGIYAAITPGFIGRLAKVSATPSKAATTGSKLSTAQARIATTSCTGGAIALTSANMTPAGVTVEGSAITALNLFTAAQSVNLLGSATTSFVEGEVDFTLHFG